MNLISKFAVALLDVESHRHGRGGPDWVRFGDAVETLSKIVKPKQPNEDDAFVMLLLARNGFVNSGDYRPAERLPDGRWSVDVSSLALLLSTYEKHR